MTPQEKQLLERFLQQMTAAQAGQKDAEADALIREASARQPDAAYLLVQRAMQLEQAFEASQTQVQKLQSELDQARGGARGGFLSDPYAWGSQPKAPAAATPGAAPAAQQPIPGVSAANPATVPAAPGRAAPGAWGGSSMLGTVATTAAGVVAGSFLYQGIQNMMHKDDHAASADRNHTAQNETPPQDAPEQIAQQDTAADYSSDSYADAGDDSGDLA